MKRHTIELLKERGVRLDDIAEIVLKLQEPYVPDLKLQECRDSVESVIAKREVQHTLITGVALDMLAEEDKLPEPLLTILKHDDFLYGVDETLALGILNVYGSIGLTNFGYLDKMKTGILDELNAHRHDPEVEHVHAFLDDLVAGIAAAAAAKIAHNRDETLRRKKLRD
jgi:phosphatidylglycerophosphatase A